MFILDKDLKEETSLAAYSESQEDRFDGNPMHIPMR